MVLNSGWGRSQSCPTPAGTPAPQCGTGVIARQIAENGLVPGKLKGPDHRAARREYRPREIFGLTMFRELVDGDVH